MALLCFTISDSLTDRWLHCSEVSPLMTTDHHSGVPSIVITSVSLGSHNLIIPGHKHYKDRSRSIIIHTHLEIQPQPKSILDPLEVDCEYPRPSAESPPNYPQLPGPSITSPETPEPEQQRITSHQSPHFSHSSHSSDTIWRS